MKDAILQELVRRERGSSYALAVYRDTAVAPSLSLIVKVRNVQSTLRRDVEHFLELLPELTPRFELVLLDQHSFDHTADIGMELARQYPQIRLIRQESLPAAFSQSDIVISATSFHWPEVQRQWNESAQIAPTPPVLPARTPLLRADLLERLSRWGTRLLATESPRSDLPVSFVAHLRKLSRMKTEVGPSQ